MKECKQPKCPKCEIPLFLANEYVGECIRKINKDGSINKKIIIHDSVQQDAYYLKCEECGYTYDIEKACRDTPVKELDDWIDNIFMMQR